MKQWCICLVLGLSCTILSVSCAQDAATAATKTLPTEKLSGQGIWLMPVLRQQANRPVRVTVWFEDQFLGDGESYMHHAKTYAYS